MSRRTTSVPAGEEHLRTAAGGSLGIASTLSPESGGTKIAASVSPALSPSPPDVDGGSSSLPATGDVAPGRGSRGRTITARLGEMVVAGRARRLLAAAVAGAVLSLTLPPFDFLPALAAYSALLALLAVGEARARRAVLERALLGGAFGFGYHLAALWWVGAAFLVDAEAFGALLPLGVVGLPILLAPFHGLAAALLGLAPRTMAWRTLGFAAALAATEWARGVVFTGFPWNAAGAQLAGFDAFAQGAALVGVAGLAPLAVLCGAVPALLTVHGARRLALAVVVVMAALAAFGATRLAVTPTADPAAPQVRVVQPVVPQAEKWDPAQRARIWSRLLALTAAEGPERAQVVVWPETAIPFLWQDESIEAAELAAVLDGRTLVTGAVALRATPLGRRATNSVLVIGPSGRVEQRYDKVRLVPFGEYLPLASVLSRLGLTALVENASDFVAGTHRSPLALPGLPSALPLICYEVIFPAGEAGPAVGLVLNVTNDAWFGDTPGPRQHFLHARLRALEGGLPVVRAANNGISAVIDGAGRVVAGLPLDARGAFEAPVPPTVAAPYAWLGHWPLLAFIVSVGGAIAVRTWRARNSVYPRVRKNTFNLFACNQMG